MIKIFLLANEMKMQVKSYQEVKVLDKTKLKVIIHFNVSRL